MPHINIKCYPGKTEEQKRLLAEKFTQDMVEIFNTKPESISIVIEEVPQEEWQETVWNRDISAKKDKLYKAPGYSLD